MAKKRRHKTYNKCFDRSMGLQPPALLGIKSDKPTDQQTDMIIGTPTAIPFRDELLTTELEIALMLFGIHSTKLELFLF